MGRTVTLLALLVHFTVTACTDPVAGNEELFVRLEPRTATLEVGDSLDFTHTSLAPGQTLRRLEVRDNGVLTVAGALRVRGTSPGDTWVLLRSAGQVDSVPVSVTASGFCLREPRIEPQVSRLTPGDTLRLSVTACGDAPADFAFTSSSPAVAVTADGLVTAVERGMAVITARSPSHPALAATAVVTVE